MRTRTVARSIALQDWAAILRVAGCHFVSLQYGDAEADVQASNAVGGTRVHHWPDAIDVYDETAALVCAVDIVITVCTSLVHLSGALGQRAWVLVPPIPEWRYGLVTDRMPWYGSVELVRQREGDGWASTLATVGGRLAELAAGCRSVATG